MAGGCHGHHLAGIDLQGIRHLFKYAEKYVDCGHPGHFQTTGRLGQQVRDCRPAQREDADVHADCRRMSAIS